MCLRQTSYLAIMVSIIMPVKNGEAFLKPCLDSIIRQTHSQWELIAVDDHSDDRTPDMLQEYANGHDRIQWTTSQGHGIPTALQTGFQHAQGNYVHRMDADDIMPTNKLELLLRKCTSGVISVGLVKYFSDSVLGEGYKKYADDLNRVLMQGNFEQHMFRECFLPSPNWMMTREDFESIGGFSSHRMPEDYDLFFRVLMSPMTISVVPQITHWWRDSEGRTSRTDSQYQQLQFFPLKLHYWKKIMDPLRPLILWGAGKKGKTIARLLIEDDISFLWLTTNKKKWKAPIFGTHLHSPESLSDIINPQIILAIAGPEDRIEITKKLTQLKLQEGRHYWFWC